MQGSSEIIVLKFGLYLKTRSENIIIMFDIDRNIVFPSINYFNIMLFL